MPPLDEHEIHLWIASLEGPREERLLSACERGRAAAFVFEADRRRFIAARSILREVLARYCDQAPERIRISVAASGKPFLEEHPVSFNVSHSGELALLAIARDQPIGVDVERLRDFSAASQVAGAYFTPAEARYLGGLAPEDRRRAFFRAWTRKEAVVKACGDGLARGLDFEALFDGSPGSAIFLPGDPRAWTVADVQVDDQVAAAVAARHPMRVRTLAWPAAPQMEMTPR